MPIYEYVCDTCQTRFERKQKFSDDPVRDCPECGADVRRVLYPAGIIFKGSGFYVTDNRGSTSTSTNANSSNGSSSTSSDSESKASAPSSESSAKSSSTAADN